MCHSLRSPCVHEKFEICDDYFVRLHDSMTQLDFKPHKHKSWFLVVFCYFSFVHPPPDGDLPGSSIGGRIRYCMLFLCF